MTAAMDEPHIRAATAADVPAVADVVDQAYRHSIARMGKPPGPMLDDYAARVAEGAVWVLEERAAITAILVLVPAPDYLLLDNIAVTPERQGSGLGRRRLAFAETEATSRIKPSAAKAAVIPAQGDAPSPLGADVGAIEWLCQDRCYRRRSPGGEQHDG